MQEEPCDNIDDVEKQEENEEPETTERVSVSATGDNDPAKAYKAEGWAQIDGLYIEAEAFGKDATDAMIELKIGLRAEAEKAIKKIWREIEKWEDES